MGNNNNQTTENKNNNSSNGESNNVEQVTNSINDNEVVTTKENASINNTSDDDFDDFFENQEDEFEKELEKQDKEKKEKEETKEAELQKENVVLKESKTEILDKATEEKMKVNEYTLEEFLGKEAVQQIENEEKEATKKTSDALKTLYDEVNDEDLIEDKEIIENGKINENLINDTSKKDFIKEGQIEAKKKEENKEPKKFNLKAEDLAKNEEELKTLKEAFSTIDKNVKEYHEKEKANDKKVTEPKKEEKAPNLSDKFPSNEETNKYFDELSNLTKGFVGSPISKESYQKEIREMTKNMDSLSNAEKQNEFGRRYSKFYRDNLTQLFNLRATKNNKNDGDTLSSIDETFEKYEKFMAAADKELKESGFLNEDYERLKPGTVSSHNIRDAIAGCIQSETNNKSKDEKGLASLYSKLNDKQKKSSFDGLSKNVDNLNKEFGTKFNAKNIEKYLAQEYKKCDGLSTKEMQTQFKDKYEAFMKSALNSMLNKRTSDSNKSINESIEALDKFSKSLEYVLKADGFLDTEYHHESLGGVKKESIKESLENHVNKEPKNMNEAMESKLNSFNTLKEKHDFVKQMIENVPDAKEGINNIDLKKTMVALNILDKQMANRSTSEKLKHPFQKGMNDKFIEKAQEMLGNKGYDKEVINSVTKNGIKENEDPVVDRLNKDKLDLSNTMKNLENKEIERQESIDARNKILNHPGKQIEVKECNTINEIVCDKNQKDKNLNLQLETNKNLGIINAGMNK